ncbi:MAG: hypothetical protein VZT48_08280 [Bulleidia sp.]|nr:hypothetical protein [Bulleidia sp.]
MKLKDRDFREYYHRFLVLEADALTERLKDTISVTESDCFILVTSAVNAEGYLRFGILSIGSSWDACRKGMMNKQILGEYAPEVLRDMACRLVDPDPDVKQKGFRWIEQMEGSSPASLRKTREEESLDHLRDDFCPDIVLTGIAYKDGIKEYPMRIRSFEGPFLTGRLLSGPGYAGQFVRALPYPTGETYRLLAVFFGDVLNDAQEKEKRQLIEEGNRIGFGFAGHDRRRQ